MNTKIFFVRHGEVNNPNKVWYGRLPGFSLSSNGKKQMSETAQQLCKNKIDAIYSSPLLRAKQSAVIISNILNLPINYSDDLLEIKSSMQGKTFAYILYCSIKLNIFASPKNKILGETIEDVAQRMKKFIARIIKKHKGKNIVVVTHGDPIMIVKAQIKRLPIEINSIRPIKGYIQPGEIYMAEFKP